MQYEGDWTASILSVDPHFDRCLCAYLHGISTDRTDDLHPDRRELGRPPLDPSGPFGPGSPASTHADSDLTTLGSTMERLLRTPDETAKSLIGSAQGVRAARYEQ